MSAPGQGRSVDDNERDAALDRFASDVTEALGHALRASDKEWKVPLLPLTIGLDRSPVVPLSREALICSSVRCISAAPPW